MGTFAGFLGSVVTTRSSSEGGRRISIREAAGCAAGFGEGRKTYSGSDAGPPEVGRGRM